MHMFLAEAGSRICVKCRCQPLAGAGPSPAMVVAPPGVPPLVVESAIAAVAKTSDMAAAARSPLRYMYVSEVDADELSTGQGIHSCACCEHRIDALPLAPRR